MREVTTWMRVDDPGEVEAALAAADLAPGDEGPLVAVLGAAVAPDQVAEVLAGWISAARDAMERDVDVVTVLSDDHLDGDDVGLLSVGHGVIGAARSWGFEGDRAGLVANVVVGPLDTALPAAAFLLDARSSSGQVLMTGDPRHGLQKP